MKRGHWTEIPRKVSRRFRPMYVETVPNRGTRPAVLSREGWREGGKVKKRTITNLSDWPQHKVQAPVAGVRANKSQ